MGTRTEVLTVNGEGRDHHFFNFGLEMIGGSLNRSVPVQDSTCRIHYADSALKVVRASKQYIYDDQGNEYLDCVSSSAHVGHCHPHVVAAAQNQMAKLATSHGFLNQTASKYIGKLLETLPSSLNTVILVNSGSEANDLALRLARQYTKRKDVAVMDNSYHGNLSNLWDLSAKVFRKLPQGKKEYVHLIPVPREDPNQENYRKFYMEAKNILDKAQANGRPVGCFMSEIILASAGIVVPPKTFFQEIYQLVRHRGGLCVAIENQTGLGRTGHYWAFQAYDVVPDILTVGKPLGNGYPVAAVVTTAEIAGGLGDYINTMGGNPVACAVGTAVLEVIAKEKVVSSAKIVGNVLMEGLLGLKEKYLIVGDVRGMGLCIGVEIVCGRPNMKPATNMASRLLYRLKEDRVIVSIQGENRNVISLTPPMCFTISDARRLIDAFDKALEKMAKGDEQEEELPSSSSILGLSSIPADVLAGDDYGEPATKRLRQYGEMD